MAQKMKLAGRGLLSLSYKKHSDSRKPINTELMLTDMDGKGYVVELSEHDLARLMSSSVVEVKIEDLP